MGDNFENFKLNQYVKYINIISCVLLVVSIICIFDLCLCTYEFNNMPAYDDAAFNKTIISQNEGLKQTSILLIVIITLGLSTTTLIMSSIFLFLFAMKIIHVSEVSRILNGINSTSKPTAQRSLLQDYEEPITSDNTRNRPSNANLYVTDRNQRQAPKMEEMLPEYEEVNDEPSYPSNRRNMSPISENINEIHEELVDYDEVREFVAASDSCKQYLPTNQEEDLPEYHEPIYPSGRINPPKVSQKPRDLDYDRLREDAEELVDYDEVRTIGEEINVDRRNMPPNIPQHSRVYEKLRKDTEELADYDEVKNVGEDINMEMKQTNKIKEKQPVGNITESLSQNEKITYSESLENLLQNLNIPANNKQENNPMNEIKMKNMNEQLYQKEKRQEKTKHSNYGIKINSTNSMAQTQAGSSYNSNLSNTAYGKYSTRVNLQPSNIPIKTNNSTEESIYDHIKK